MSRKRNFDDLKKDLKNPYENKSMDEKIELIWGTIEKDEDIDINTLFYLAGSKRFFQFDEKDREEIIDIYKEFNIRTELERLNPYMCGREVSINRSRVSSMQMRLKRLKIGMKKND